jgi:hypothetical protein
MGGNTGVTPIPVEKRATRRFALQLPVSVKHPQRGEIAAQTRDVSSRGICFYIDTSFAVGSNLEFTLTLPPEVTLTEAIRVRCKARVVRVEPGAEKESIAVAAIIDRYEFLSDRR